MLNRPEILAPAGSMDALKAAVSAGADACYAGGDMFSARAFAGNFDTTELLEAIDYCHIHNVKLYMAVNTLLKNSEMKKLIPYLEPFYREGVDGIIVQDVGVIRSLSQAYPDLPLHGSTQMSVCSTYGAEFLKNLGLTRFVPARELSLKEIKSIKEAAKKLIEDAKAVEEAGAFLLVLECVPAKLAKLVTESINIPTIGIGAGAGCDGQVLVIYDMLGMFSDFKPKFVKHFANAGDVIREAVKTYIAEIDDGTFPAEEHCYKIDDEVIDKLY